MKIYTKFQNRSIQDIKVTRDEHQMNMSLNEINSIVTCANHLNKSCYYGRHCKFLNYSLRPKVTNNQQTPHNESNGNNEIHSTKQQQQQKNLTSSKKKINNQKVKLKEKLTQLIKQESLKEMLQTTMINTLASTRSNKQQTSKILNITYSNARGIKSKTKNIKQILFGTQCDIFTITETILKETEKINKIHGLGKAQHQKGRYRIPNKHKHQNSYHNRTTRKHKN